MVVGLKLLIEDSDSVPELGILDVIQTIQGSLVSIEGLLEIIHKKIAVTKGCPGWSILWVDGDELDVVLNCSMVLSLGGTELCQLVDLVDIDEVVSISCSQVLGDFLGLL